MSARPNQKKIHCLLEKLPSLCLKYQGLMGLVTLERQNNVCRSLRSLVSSCLLVHPVMGTRLVVDQFFGLKPQMDLFLSTLH